MLPFYGAHTDLTPNNRPMQALGLLRASSKEQGKGRVGWAGGIER